jgi:hypothetical protein
MNQSICGTMRAAPRRAIRNASEAVLCTGFVAKHPAFTGIPMDELNRAGTNRMCRGRRVSRTSRGA